MLTIGTNKGGRRLTSAAVPSKGTPHSRRAATAPSVSAMTALEYQSVKACSRVCSFGRFACKHATGAVKRLLTTDGNKGRDLTETGTHLLERRRLMGANEEYIALYHKR